MNNSEPKLIPTEISGYSKRNAALINTDENALLAYKRKKAVDRKVNDKISLLEKRIETLENQISILMESRNG